MSLRYVKHFDLNILKLAYNLILHGNLFQKMAELYANDFFIIFVFGRITVCLNKKYQPLDKKDCWSWQIAITLGTIILVYWYEFEVGKLN